MLWPIIASLLPVFRNNLVRHKGTGTDAVKRVIAQTYRPESGRLKFSIKLVPDRVNRIQKEPDLDCLWQRNDSRLMTHLSPSPSSAYSSPTNLVRWVDRKKKDGPKGSLVSRSSPTHNWILSRSLSILAHRFSPLPRPHLSFSAMMSLVR